MAPLAPPLDPLLHLIPLLSIVFWFPTPHGVEVWCFTPITEYCVLISYTSRGGSMMFYPHYWVLCFDFPTPHGVEVWCFTPITEYCVLISYTSRGGSMMFYPHYWVLCFDFLHLTGWKYDVLPPLLSIVFWFPTPHGVEVWCFTPITEYCVLISYTSRVEVWCFTPITEYCVLISYTSRGGSMMFYPITEIVFWFLHLTGWMRNFLHPWLGLHSDFLHLTRLVYNVLLPYTYIPYTQAECRIVCYRLL